jgi:sugar phosphate permease
MKNVLWLLLLAFAAVAVWLVRHGLRNWQARMRAGEARAAVEAQKKKLPKA